MTAAPDTWMPFWIGPYLANTMHLTREQHGSYVLLIIACWKGGGTLPNDDRVLATIARCSARQWKAERDIFAAFFNVTDGGWTHERVVSELGAAARHAERRRAMAQHAASVRWGGGRDAAGNAEAMRTACPSPSPTPTPSPATATLSGSSSAREPRARLIPEDWLPSELDLAALAKERPDVVGELYERRMRDFRDWCRAKAVTSHDVASTWRSFMRRTDAPREASAWRSGGGQPGRGQPAEHRPSIRMGGPDCLWKLRLTGYRPGDPWKYEGDPPGGANCKVPAELIPHWQAYVRELEEAG